MGRLFYFVVAGLLAAPQFGCLVTTRAGAGGPGYGPDPATAPPAGPVGGPAVAPPAAGPSSMIGCSDTGASVHAAVVTCPPGCSTSGSLWGSGMYTTDSSVCLAAMHSGLSTMASGGTFHFANAPGMGSYSGSSRYGVSSASWGSYASSFTVSPAGGGGTAVAPPAYGGGTAVAPPAYGGYAVGSAVSCEWKGSWYNAQIIGVRSGAYLVHYDGYASSWDEWVAPGRIRPR